MTVNDDASISTLYNIQQLQEMEQDLQAKLEKLVLENSKTPQTDFATRRDDLVNQINQLSLMRTNLYATIPSKYERASENASQSYDTLREKKDFSRYG